MKIGVPLLAFVAALVGSGSAWSQGSTPGATTLPPGHAENGQTVFKKCLACHQIGPTAKNSIGPSLNGIIGRPAGIYPGYAYSEANKNSGVVWNEASLAQYLPAPKDFIPGTKMSFPGLTMPQDVADVIAYLKQFDANGNMIETTK
jgi:cytochrome c